MAVKKGKVEKVIKDYKEGKGKKEPVKVPVVKSKKK